MKYYHITRFDDPADRGINPKSINDHGIAAGTDAEARGFIKDTSTGAVSYIDRGSSNYMYVSDINNSGQVVGGLSADNNIDRAFVYDSTTGVRTDVNIDNSMLSAVNDAGLAIGFSWGNDVRHAFIDDTRTGTITPLHIPGATNASASGINQAGDIGGDYTDASGRHNGFVRHSDGTFEWVHVPSTNSTSVDAINDKRSGCRDVLQRSRISRLRRGPKHSYLSDDRRPRSVRYRHPRPINNSGLVLGGTYYSGPDHSFVYDTNTSELSSFSVAGAWGTEVQRYERSRSDCRDCECRFSLSGRSRRSPLLLPRNADRDRVLAKRPVEQLAIGDMLVTASGRCRPVKWVGHTRYDARRIERNADVLPVCIKTGALGPGVPRRDLWVSPGHAMLVDGALVHARLLLNGTSIVQAETVESLTYVHVELDGHDIIVAEGAQAESFLDNGCRRLFHNAADFWRRYPKAVPSTPCMPLLEEGFALQAVRDRIDRRAGLAAARSQKPGPLRGFVDSIASGAIRGWAQDKTRPEEAVHLDVLVDGTRVLPRGCEPQAWRPRQGRPRQRPPRLRCAPTRRASRDGWKSDDQQIARPLQ